MTGATQRQTAVAGRGGDRGAPALDAAQLGFCASGGRKPGLSERTCLATTSPISLEDLKKEHQNCLVMDFSGEKPKRVNLVDKWLEDPNGAHTPRA